jgi:hypothetical protein
MLVIELLLAEPLPEELPHLSVDEQEYDAGPPPFWLCFLDHTVSSAVWLALMRLLVGGAPAAPWLAGSMLAATFMWAWAAGFASLAGRTAKVYIVRHDPRWAPPCGTMLVAYSLKLGELQLKLGELQLKGALAEQCPNRRRYPEHTHVAAWWRVAAAGLLDAALSGLTLGAGWALAVLLVAGDTAARRTPGQAAMGVRPLREVARLAPGCVSPMGDSGPLHRSAAGGRPGGRLISGGVVPVSSSSWGGRRALARGGGGVAGAGTRPQQAGEARTSSPEVEEGDWSSPVDRWPAQGRRLSAGTPLTTPLTVGARQAATTTAGTSCLNGTEATHTRARLVSGQQQQRHQAAPRQSWGSWRFGAEGIHGRATVAGSGMEGEGGAGSGAAASQGVAEELRQQALRSSPPGSLAAARSPLGGAFGWRELLRGNVGLLMSGAAASPPRQFEGSYGSGRGDGAPGRLGSAAPAAASPAMPSLRRRGSAALGLAAAAHQLGSPALHRDLRGDRGGDWLRSCEGGAAGPPGVAGPRLGRAARPPWWAGAGTGAPGEAGAYGELEAARDAEEEEEGRLLFSVEKPVWLSPAARVRTAGSAGKHDGGVAAPGQASGRGVLQPR